MQEGPPQAIVTDPTRDASTKTPAQTLFREVVRHRDLSVGQGSCREQDRRDSSRVRDVSMFFELEAGLPSTVADFAAVALAVRMLVTADRTR